MNPKVLNVPILKRIFSKILKAENPYCILCLRTSDETRLVTPNYFKKYMQATSISSPIEVTSVCYICERKSKQALLLYQSAVFSTTITLVMQELLRRRVTDENVIFEMNYFKKVIANIGLSSKLTAQEIQNELQYIRSSSCLSQTNMVVTDSTQPIPKKGTNSATRKEQTNVPNTTTIQVPVKFPNLVPILPALQPKVDAAASSQQSNITKEQDSCVVIDDEDDRPADTPAVPRRVSPVDAAPTNHFLLTRVADVSATAPNGAPKIVTMEDIESQSENQTNFLLHDIFLTSDNKYIVPSLGADIIENNVVFYDSAKKIISKQPLSLNSDFLKANAVIKRTKNKEDSQKVINKKTNLKMKSMEQIQNIRMADVDITNIQNKTIVLMSNTDSPQTNTSLVNKTDSFRNDPVSVYSDNCEAIIVNAINTNQNRGLVVSNTGGDSVKKKYMLISGAVPNSNEFVCNANDIQNNMAAVSAINNIMSFNNRNLKFQLQAVCVGDKRDGLASDVRKRRKTDDTSWQVMGTSSNVTGIMISDISSDMDVVHTTEKAGTDWEDKIPMDVISFMDAVDPNADKILNKRRGPTSSTIKISQPISLAKQTRSAGVDNDVIDLC